MTTIDFGTMTSVAASTAQPVATLPTAIDLPLEAVEAFVAAMERPLADNKAAQHDFECAVKAFAEATASHHAVASMTNPVARHADVAPAAMSAAGAESVASPAVASACESADPVAGMAKPATEATLDEMSEAATRSPRVIATDHAPLKATPETLKDALVENRVLAKSLAKNLETLNSSTLQLFGPSAEAVASLIQPVVQPIQGAVVVQAASDAVEAVSARAVASVERVERVVSASEMMVRAAEAVADAILVTPGLMRGEGEIMIRLKPEVLDGSAVKIAVAGHRLSVEFQPQVAETALFIERNLPQLQQVLVARIHSFSVAVSVRKDRDGRA